MARPTMVLLTALLPLAAVGGAATPPPEAKVDGYLEWRSGDLLIVDGQRVRPAPEVKFSGRGEAGTVASIPLGYELKAKGKRTADGVILAREIEAKPNGSALFESEVIAATDEAEQSYRRAGRFFETDAKGHMQNKGRLYESGPEVDRVRRVVDTLTPPYVEPGDFRVYVIDNKDWNAFAMGNRSIYVYTGLLHDTDDDELAIVLGHEMVHATHEHTRREVKRAMWIQVAALGVSAAATQIDDENKQAVVQLVTLLGASIFTNGYGRDLEDQADRVGIRYAYEAGYDVTRGPQLWNRFAKKYGQSSAVVNFFFGDHSRAQVRAANLERELAFNYPDGPKTGDTRAARAGAAAPRSSGGTTVATTTPPSAGGPSGRATGTALAGAGAARDMGVKPGMTAEEVQALLGAPEDEVVFGSTTRWTYPDLSVIFENGRVKEVRF